MAEVHWLNPVSGNFNTAPDWTGGRVPGRGDDVFIDAAGKTPYTVTVTTQKDLSTLRVAATATVELNSLLQTGAGAKNAGIIIVGVGGSFQAASTGTGMLNNTGTISVKYGGSLGLSRDVQNSGVIEAAGRYALISPGTTPCTLAGGGNVVLDGGVIVGGSSKRFPTELTNVDNTISGVGEIQRLVLFDNQFGGVVDADAKGALVFASSGLTLTNAGLIEATNNGVCKIERAVANTGTLLAAGGTLEFTAAVSGTGEVDLAAGKIVIKNADATEDVAFTGKGGTLELDRSQTFGGSISGLTTNGKSKLDVRDIDFVSANEATYSGTATSGVLTITDGTHTASITFDGDYLGATFVASSDGHGGTDVVAASSQNPSAAHFVSAMAGMIGHSAGSGLINARTVNDGRQMTLAAPLLALA